MSAVGEWFDKTFRTSPKNVPSSSALSGNDGGIGGINSVDRSRVGKPRASMYRAWAEHGEWVRSAVNIRKTQISQSDWDIVKHDPEGPDPSPELRRKVKDLFTMPNPRSDSWRSFIEPIIEDLLVLDAGVIEKERTLRGELVGLWPVDGAKIKVSSIWDGTDVDEPRYFWYPDNYERDKFKDDDMIYMMESPATYRVVGLSKLESLKATIDAELHGHQYNHRQVVNAAPDGMLDLGEGARPEQVDAFKSYWQAEVAGRGAMAFIGGSKNAKFIPFRGTNRDMQFLEWQLYFVRKICAVFGLSPQDLGVTADINRATADVQSEQSEDRGLRPLLGLLAEYLTREIVWDATFGGRDNNLAFRFTRLNLKESMSRAQVNAKALAGIPWKSINQARREDGLEPLDGEVYDKILVVTPTGAVSLDEVPSASESMASRKPEPPTPGTPGKPPPGKKPTGGSNQPSGSSNKKEH